MFFEHQINILEWFLKDHVTLKTGVISIIGINYIQKYIKIENFKIVTFTIVLLLCLIK